ncbi:hypothetical protein ISS06_01040 [Patescibacteria group bacterium]|nr:hypothetical protein [Patescibacteria group bacterium]
MTIQNFFYASGSIMFISIGILVIILLFALILIVFRMAKFSKNLTQMSAIIKETSIKAKNKLISPIISGVLRTILDLFKPNKQKNNKKK